MSLLDSGAGDGGEACRGCRGGRRTAFLGQRVRAVGPAQPAVPLQARLPASLQRVEWRQPAGNHPHVSVNAGGGRGDRSAGAATSMAAAHAWEGACVPCCVPRPLSCWRAWRVVAPTNPDATRCNGSVGLDRGVTAPCYQSRYGCLNAASATPTPAWPTPAVFPNVKVPPEQTRAAGYSECAMEGLAVKPRKGDAGGPGRAPVTAHLHHTLGFSHSRPYRLVFALSVESLGLSLRSSAVLARSSTACSAALHRTGACLPPLLQCCFSACAQRARWTRAACMAAAPH